MLAPPCAMVIFGAAGDLTKRLVMPALYNLVNAKRLPEQFRIVGVDLAAKTAEEWRKGLTDMMNELVTQDGEFQADHIDQAAWRWLTDRMTYLQGDLTDPAAFSRIREHLAGLDKTAGTAGNASFLSRRRRSLLQRRGRGPRGCRPGDGKRRAMAPGRDREAVRP